MAISEVPGTRATTKRVLAALSHAIEELAAATAADATIVALFQRGPYFAPMVRRYERLAADGADVIVAYAGDGPTAEGVHHVRLGDADPLVDCWTIVLVTDSMAAHVTAGDLVDFDPSEADLEAGRRFEGSWGFNRLDAVRRAEEIVEQLGPDLESNVQATVRQALQQARCAPPTPTETGLGAAARVLIERLESAQHDAAVARAALAAETELATRDPLTGLFNREGLQRWLGGSATDGLVMPEMGVILIDLDKFKLINDELGHLVGDRVLVAVADSLLGSTRPGDIVTRWGGDEFLVLCPGADDQELARVAGRLLDSVAAIDLDGVTIRASAGLQTCSRRPLPLAGADEALYAAKAVGGGVSVVAGRV